MMNINALPSSGAWYTPAVASSPANSQSNNSPNANDAAAASAVGLESTQVTLSASATLNFYDIPSSLNLQPTQQSNPWSTGAQPAGSAAQSGSSLLGSFAENELASALGSPSALNGATVTMNSFSSQSTQTAGSAQETSNGQSGQAGQSATVLEASNSITVQGSGEITLANGEVIPFNATLSTSESVVESSATQTTQPAQSTSSGTADTSPSSTSGAVSPNQSFSIPASHKATAGAGNEWSAMLQQYDYLLNLFDTVKAAVGNLPASQSSATGASGNGSPAASPIGATNAVASTGAVATA